MLNFDKLIFSSNAYNILSLDCKSKRISHAYLFVSKDENLLKRFCEVCAKLFINLDPSANEEKNNLRIDKGVHPDVKFFGLDKTINTETAKDIVEQASYSPFESDKKVFVLWNVGSMNEASQNKILKTIEEPPENTFFVLAANSTVKLLPTILSRIKLIEIDELKAEQIYEMLVESGVEKTRAEICSSSARGNATYAEKLATDDGFLDFYNQIVSAFFEINGSRDVLKFSNIFNAKTINKREFLDIFMMIARDVSMIIAKNDGLVVNKNLISKLKVVASMLNFDAVSEVVKECLEQKKNLDYNVNGTSVIDSVLFKLAEVKVKCRRLLA